MRDQVLYVITTSYNTPIRLPYDPNLSPNAQLLEWKKNGVLNVGDVTVWRVRPQKKKRTSRRPRVYRRVNRLEMDTPFRFQRINYESFIELVPNQVRHTVISQPIAPLPEKVPGLYEWIRRVLSI